MQFFNFFQTSFSLSKQISLFWLFEFAFDIWTCIDFFISLNLTWSCTVLQSFFSNRPLSCLLPSWMLLNDKIYDYCIEISIILIFCGMKILYISSMIFINDTIQTWWISNWNTHSKLQIVSVKMSKNSPKTPVKTG